MAWVILFIGSLCEVGWLIALKYSEGLSRLPSILVTVGFMGASVGCLGLAVKTIPMGTAYAAWTGASIAVATLFGIYLFDEPTTATRLASIGLIVLGIVGLRLESG
ncbi:MULTISPECIES: multidrug efflux SMR transporter [unclassified Bradyrhizobium]|uniref:DMT family transporter n=1 Tax=Bradyrhizobium TaxID=374 RepID=UPI0028E35EC4|nr:MULTISPECIES: multidrug efflux SMR transporter [unclassified Bradyrhizobium]